MDMSPSRYIVKVERATGEPLSDPIDPADLLVHAHRDRHPVEIAAQFLASRFIQLTGNESFVKRGLRGIEALGSRVGRTVGELTGNPEDGSGGEAAPGRDRPRLRLPVPRADAPRARRS